MKIQVRHTFPCDCAAFWDMFWDPAYNRMLDENGRVTRETFDDRTEGTVRTWRVRTVPDRELPSAVRGLLGADRLEYEQINRLDTATGTLTWEVVPKVLRDKVTARGTMTVTASADGGCTRVVDGDIEVRIPLVGGRVERAIVSEVEQSYAQAAETAHRWLARG